MYPIISTGMLLIMKVIKMNLSRLHDMSVSEKFDQVIIQNCRRLLGYFSL